MNHYYNDMRVNYPNIYSLVYSGYQDERNSDWNRPTIFTRWDYFRVPKKRSNAVARSAKKSSASKKRRYLERFTRFNEYPKFPQRNKPLVLYFYGSINFGYIATTNAGYFLVNFIEHGNHDLDYAICQFKRHDGTIILESKAKTVGGAISSLCAMRWATFKAWNKPYSLYSFYKAIHFWFEDKPKSHKQPRNNTRTIKMPKEYINHVYGQKIGIPDTLKPQGKPKKHYDDKLPSENLTLSNTLNRI